MHLRITRLLWPICCAGLFDFSVEVCWLLKILTDAKAICNDLSADNRAMAQAAGYDVDELCRSLNKRSSIAGDKDS